MGIVLVWRLPGVPVARGSVGGHGGSVVWMLSALPSLLSSGGTWGQSRLDPFPKFQPAPGPCPPVQGHGDNPDLAHSQGLSPSPGPCAPLEGHGDSPALAYSQGPSPSLGSSPALEGHGDIAFLPLFPGDPAPQISVGSWAQPCPIPVPQFPTSVGTWGQPFSAPLPKVPALPRVPALYEGPVPAPCVSQIVPVP